jgi:hypothetical protein
VLYFLAIGLTILSTGGRVIIAANQWQLPWFRYWFSKFRFFILAFVQIYFQKNTKWTEVT